MSRHQDRIRTALQEHRAGLTRTQLYRGHAEGKNMLEALAELVASGEVTEIRKRSGTGHPIRLYRMTKYLARSETERGYDFIPHGRDIITAIVAANPGISRSAIWKHAVARKSWIGDTIDALVAQGVIEERVTTTAAAKRVRSYYKGDEYGCEPTV